MTAQKGSGGRSPRIPKLPNTPVPFTLHMHKAKLACGCVLTWNGPPVSPPCPIHEGTSKKLELPSQHCACAKQLVLLALACFALACGGEFTEPDDAGLCPCVTCIAPAMLPCDGGVE